MDEKTFKTQFIATFLASYAASRYQDCCSRGDHSTILNPPVEDAMFLADAAWEKLQELGS